MALHPTETDPREDALAQLRDGKPAEAAELIARHLRPHPDDILAWQILGISLSQAGHLESAVEAFSEAVLRAPQDHEARNNLGKALRDLGRDEEAIPVLLDAVRLRPTHPESLDNLAGALYGTGRLTDALEIARHRTDLYPDDARGWLLQTEICWGRGQREEMTRAALEAARCDPAGPGMSSALMALHYDPEVTGEDIRRAAEAWARQFPPRPRPSFRPRRDRLRIGYVSADLGRHPAGYRMQTLVPLHDRRRFEIVAFPAHRWNDHVEKELRGSFDAWLPIHDLNDSAAAALIAAQEIDILVDMNGHTNHHRLGVFAHRPAPVQVSWLGYFGTLGLEAIDAFLGDPVTLPQSERHHWTERPLPWAAGAFPFRPAPAPQGAQAPCLRHGHVTFGVFCTLIKVSRPALEAWARVLHAVPGSRLLMDRRGLEDPETAELYRRPLRELGIADERIQFEASRGHERYLQRFQEVDIMLDTFPFNGSTVVTESISQGVPVVSRRWPRMGGHFAEQVLNPLGLGHWVADSTEEYVAIARRLASDTEELGRLRVSLPSALAASPLCHPEAFLRSYEAVLESLDQELRAA